ncbi:tetratricopeptide repeat protein [Paenibacillus sp. KS1]|uniref:tetratricopeptide repeat protein n=1 Tax=Paenibacillus sp. KS1 TaxID=1849249 RepID=UPI0009F6E786|nr:tetratricopeptide repeat protein [Paenibacillus sp. KS1]
MPASMHFNCTFYFDDDLREVPHSLSDMCNAIAYIKEQTQSDQQNQEELGRQYGMLGVYSRIVGNYADSITYLTSAISIHSAMNNAKQVWINKLRLAHSYQWMRNFHTSNRMFDDLLEHAISNDQHFNLLDFLYQHYGKNLYDQYKYESALPWFEKALKIRTKSENEELIHSSQIAIDACIKHILKESGKSS